jgi:hypothetical protein
MPAALPPLTAHLDPRDERDAARAPIADAVNIPLRELPSRTHELPAADRTIRVVGESALAGKAVRWLHAAGRAAEACSTFEFVDSDQPRGRLRLWSPSEAGLAGTPSFSHRSAGA